MHAARVLSCSTSASARCGASIGNSRRAVGMRSAMRARAPRRAGSRRARRRGPARGCGRAARLRGSGRAGAARATAAAPRAAPPRPATGAAAPCRSRRARPRARPRGCRRRARGADRAAGSRPSRAAARAASARSACRTLPAPVRSCSPCSSRATCMVSVEPPETMRPWRDELPAGAADGPGVDAAVRAEALVLEGHQHGEIARVDVLRLDRQPPAAVGRGVGAQQPVVAVEHGHRQRLGARQRQRLHALPEHGERTAAPATRKRARSQARCAIDAPRAMLPPSDVALDAVDCQATMPHADYASQLRRSVAVATAKFKDVRPTAAHISTSRWRRARARRSRPAACATPRDHASLTPWP